MARNTPSRDIQGIAVERLALPRAEAWDESGSDTSFAPFLRLAARCTDSLLAVLVVEAPSGLQIQSVSGNPGGEALPVSLLRAQMSRPRRTTYEVPNLLADPAFAAAPAHEREAGFASYAGATIRNPSGTAIGPISFRTQVASSLSSASVGSMPRFSVT